MPKIILFIILFIFSEILVAFFFSVIAQIFYEKIGFDFKSIFKGIIERVFLLIAFLNDYPSALTFFSALKLATRLKHKDRVTESGEGYPMVESNKFNDYYLLGNLISVLFAIGYTSLYRNLDCIPILSSLIH